MDQIITELNAFIFRIQFVVLVPGLIVAVTGPRALTDCWRRRVTWGFLCGGRLGRGSEQGLTDDSPPPPLHWAHSNNLARRLSSTPKSFEGWCSFTPRTIFNSRALETRRNGTVGRTRKVVCAERLRLYCWGQCGLIVHLCTVQTTGTGPRGPRCSCGCARSRTRETDPRGPWRFCGCAQPGKRETGPRGLRCSCGRAQSRPRKTGQTSPWCSCGCAQPGTRATGLRGPWRFCKCARPRTWETGQMGPWYLRRCAQARTRETGQTGLWRFCVHPLHSTT